MILIVGGGIAGLTIGWRLARAGEAVIVQCGFANRLVHGGPYLSNGDIHETPGGRRQTEAHPGPHRTRLSFGKNPAGCGFLPQQDFRPMAQRGIMIGFQKRLCRFVFSTRGRAGFAGCAREAAPDTPAHAAPARRRQAIFRLRT